ncbi:hypothetical protein VPHD148_0295 [Vibrio phage D148]
MVKKIQPKPYYLVDMGDIGEEYSDEIYQWAYGQDVYLPDGDGHVHMWGIPGMIKKHEWADTAWQKLTLFQQNEVMRHDAEFAIGIYQ